MRRWIGVAATLALLGATLTTPGAAHAQSAKASAEVLFGEGRRLMGEGKVDEACPKFADSHKLDPSSSTLLNLANCYEKLGRNASAWATYQEAASLASGVQRADHLAVAQKRAAALLPLLAKVTVMVPRPVEGLEIKRDGLSVTRGEWALAVPVDPGNHTYLAEAVGYKPLSLSLNVPPTAEGAPPPSLTITIPELEKLPPPKDQPLVVEPAGPVGPPPSTWRPQRTWALVVGGVGVVSLGVAGAFTAVAKSTYTGSLSSCAPTNPNRCSASGVSQRDDARRQGDIATATVAIGGGAAALGIILWLTAPAPAVPRDAPAKRAGFEISPGPGSVMVSGRW